MKPIQFYKIYSKLKSKSLNSGKWVDGMYMKELENKIAEYLKVKHVILTSNGTTALLAAYWVLKKDFSELNVDPYTFPATYQPARVLGYKVNYSRSILTKEGRLPTSGLRAVVHLFGQPNKDVLNESNNCIEDACQSFGAEIDGKKVGTIGRIGCYSFYPTKSLHTCGHGGAIVTNNDTDYREMKIFVECGRENGKMTDSMALNLRMDEVKAEYLLSELENYDERMLVQHQIAREFAKLIPTPQPFLNEDKGDRHIYSVCNLLVNDRDKFREFMSQKGIETIVYYGPDILPSTEREKYNDLTSRIVAIPCRWNLTDSEIKRIKLALSEWFK